MWHDFPASLIAAFALVNDLDLLVESTTTNDAWIGNGALGEGSTVRPCLFVAFLSLSSLRVSLVVFLCVSLPFSQFLFPLLYVGNTEFRV